MAAWTDQEWAVGRVGTVPQIPAAVRTLACGGNTGGGLLGLGGQVGAQINWALPDPSYTVQDAVLYLTTGGSGTSFTPLQDFDMVGNTTGTTSQLSTVVPASAFRSRGYNTVDLGIVLQRGSWISAMMRVRVTYSGGLLGLSPSVTCTNLN